MKKLIWILSILTVISTVAMLFILPDTVPVHFDINGVADRWGSKYELLILPAVLVPCAFTLYPMEKWYRKKAEKTDDEKEKAEHLTNAKVFGVAGVSMMLLFFFMNIIILYSTYVQVNPDSNLPKLDMFRGVGVVMGITLIVLGNYMPKTRNNQYIGFRFPWTRYNDTTWNKSNRFASYVIMIGGAISVIASLFVRGELASFVIVGALLIVIPIIMIYAYIVYRQEKSKYNERIHKE